MYKFAFEKLVVWEKSRALVNQLYTLSKDFPESEKYALTNQLRRASISVMSNIAEGSSRSSKRDQSHFYQLSYSSLMEVLSLIILCNDIQLIAQEKYTEIRAIIEVISRLLNALHNSQRNS
jgi:four helix bundle protein